MDAGLIARRYATVLHDFAADRGKLQEVYDDAQIVRQVLSSQPAAQQYFESPLHKPSEKKALVDGAFASHVADETLQFLNFLVDKERISLVSNILLVFEQLYKKEKNICTATITTAKELTPQQQQHISSQIVDKFKAAGNKVAAIDATFKVDPRLIGGIILTVDGKQVDDSVLYRLKKIEKQLTV